MDNTPRGRIGEHATMARPNNPDMLWIDAICQQALSARTMSKMYALIGDKDNEEKWNKKYLEKKEIVNTLYWDDKDKFYYDIDCNTHEFYKIMTIASYWTMTAEIASKEQAQELVKQLLNPDTLGGQVSFLSLSKKDNDYNPGGAYWRGSIWLPTAYASLKGLANYGMYSDAHKESVKLLEHMYKTYTEYSPHTIWECYAPESYSPATNEYEQAGMVRPDFCGWSALGPISVYIEYVLGFHTVNAFTNVVEWEKPDDINGRIGIKNLRFGDIVTDIEAVGEKCSVKSNGAYTLKIKGKPYEIHEGTNEFDI
jgi:glycogen debranching enzyme